jgi:hypothetical protein
METNEDTGISGSNGAIYRLELDGSVPADNPFANHPKLNFRRAFAYGIRNAFGMAFDPLSDRLWYTENGPEIYDEINIAEPGLNSGWRKIMGPDSRDAMMAINNGKSYNQKDLFMVPGAHYSDPVFSYLTPIGITCIEFLWGTKFPEDLRRQAILSCTSVGRLFLLPVTPNRLDLFLPRTLADRVADTAAERDEFVLGTGWGSITDARVGPDGYLYLNGIGLGSIFRIRPKAEWTPAESIKVLRGVSTGWLPEILRSDDIYLNLRPGVALSTATFPSVIEVESKSPFVSPGSLKFYIEAAANSSTIVSRVELYDFASAKYTNITDFQLTAEDETLRVSVLEGAERFVDPETQFVRTRISFKAPGPILSFPWTARIDRVFWIFTRA